MKLALAKLCRWRAARLMREAQEWFMWCDPEWYRYHRRLAVKWLRRARRLEANP